MSIEGFRLAISKAKDKSEPADIRAISVQIAQAEILEAIHQRLMNLALKGDK